MLSWFRILLHNKKLCLLGTVAFCLLNLQSASAWAPRTIDFGEKKEASSGFVSLAILGEVKNPATYQVSQKDVTLEQLIQIAGGATPDAGRKVRVVRGGRSLLVLLRPSQDHFKLLQGDVVVLDHQWQSSARTISFEHLPKSSSAAGSQPIVFRANYQQNQKPRHHGQIVLLGLTNEPVVLPLWDDELTIDSLLTDWMKQPREVATGTRIIFGQKQQLAPGQIAAGMVLSVPAALVHSAKLPQLPSPVIAKNSDQPETAERRDIQTSPQASPSPVNNWTTEGNKENLPAEKIWNHTSPIQSSSTPSSSASKGLVQGAENSKIHAATGNSSTKPLMLIPQDLVSEQAAVELEKVSSDPSDEPFLEFDQELFSTSSSETKSISEDAGTILFSEGSDFTDLLQKKQGDNIHVARAGEVVPNPVDPNKAGGPTLIGFIAGAIVVIGVMTVIISALRNQLIRPAHHVEELEHSPRQATSPPAGQPDETHHRFRQRISPVVQEALLISQDPGKSSAPVSDPLTRAKQQKEDGLQALLENQIPILEEQVLLPRELKFFGKPILHYEFRIDASHEIKRPYLAPAGDHRGLKKSSDAQSTQSIPAPKHVSASKGRQKQGAPIFWEGETGLFVSPYELYQATTSSDR